MIPKILLEAIKLGAKDKVSLVARDRISSPLMKLTKLVSPKTKPKVYGNPNLGNVNKLKEQSNLTLQRNPDVKSFLSSQARDRISSPLMKLTRATAGNVGPSALGASTMIGGAGAYGLYNMIQGFIDNGDLDSDFEEADLERIMMEKEYDSENTNGRSGMSGRRDSQGDFMTLNKKQGEK